MKIISRKYWQAMKNFVDSSKGYVATAWQSHELNLLTKSKFSNVFVKIF